MKSRFILLFALMASICVNAQDLTSKKGENYLPEQGEWAIGFDAHPFLDYFGNLFNSNAVGPSANYVNSVNTIYGKMFTTPNSAYRAKVRIGLNTVTDKEFVTDLSSSDPAATVEDEQKISSTFVGLGAGLEKRRGNTRLQGVYGAEAFIWLSNSKTTYEYGNALGSSNPINSNVFDPSMDGITEVKSGSVFGVQVRGFIGCEYFIVPKISIGAEYGWGIAFSSEGDGETTGEAFTGSAVESTTVSTAGGSSISLDTDINNANAASGVLGDMALVATFHF